ncbi:hypothetical protein [Streptomyces sp. NPDC004589]|uniref:hypothetical protein n=1 Tax=unclassified Streptomyces TaxID=2593676 RepID=UPI0033AD542C
MADNTSPRRRPAVTVLVVWPALSLAAWGMAHVFGGPEGLADSAVTVGALMAAVAVVERTRQWRKRGRRGRALGTALRPSFAPGGGRPDRGANRADIRH